MLFLERVQKSLLPRSFEKMDPGKDVSLSVDIVVTRIPHEKKLLETIKNE